MRIKEHDCVVLKNDLPGAKLQKGDVGAVVHVHRGGEGYEVEFVTLAGRTVAIATVKEDDIRPVGPRDMGHVREMPLRAKKAVL